MRKPPVYNPLAMSSLEYANSYGKSCARFDKNKQKKRIELNRKNKPEMDIKIESDTKETRIADLERKYKFSKISDTLYKRAMKSLELGKSVIYEVDGNTGKVKNISVKK